MAGTLLRWLIRLGQGQCTSTRVVAIASLLCSGKYELTNRCDTYLIQAR